MRSGRLGRVNFGSPTDAAKISTQKALQQKVTKARILAVHDGSLQHLWLSESAVRLLRPLFFPSCLFLPCRPGDSRLPGVNVRGFFLPGKDRRQDRKSTRLNSSHGYISYA